MNIQARKIQFLAVSAIIYSTKELILQESAGFRSEILMKYSAITIPGGGMEIITSGF